MSRSKRVFLVFLLVLVLATLFGLDRVYYVSSQQNTRWVDYTSEGEYLWHIAGKARCIWGMNQQDAVSEISEHNNLTDSYVSSGTVIQIPVWNDK
jgi:hypothetical protein